MDRSETVPLGKHQAHQGNERQAKTCRVAVYTGGMVHDSLDGPRFSLHAYASHFCAHSSLPNQRTEHLSSQTHPLHTDESLSRVLTARTNVSHSSTFTTPVLCLRDVQDLYKAWNSGMDIFAIMVAELLFSVKFGMRILPRPTILYIICWLVVILFVSVCAVATDAYSDINLNEGQRGQNKTESSHDRQGSSIPADKLSSVMVYSNGEEESALLRQNTTQRQRKEGHLQARKRVLSAACFT